MPNPLELKQPPPRILITGPAGNGKTSFLMTCGSKLQMVETERGGWSPALTYKDVHQAERQKVDVIECYEDPGKPGSGLVKIKEHIFKVCNSCAVGNYPWKIFALDSLTGLCEQAFRHVLANSGKLVQGIVPMLISPKGAPYTGIDMSHYGIAMQEVENCLQLLHSLPIPVVVLGHNFVEIMTSTNLDGTIAETRKERLLALGNKLGPKIPIPMSEHWQAVRQAEAGGKYTLILQTSGDMFLEAKSRASLGNKIPMSTGLPQVLKQMGYEL